MLKSIKHDTILTISFFSFYSLFLLLFSFELIYISSFYLIQYVFKKGYLNCDNNPEELETYQKSIDVVITNDGILFFLFFFFFFIYFLVSKTKKKD